MCPVLSGIHPYDPVLDKSLWKMDGWMIAMMMVKCPSLHVADRAEGVEEG